VEDLNIMWMRRIKIICALLLLISIFMPMSSCNRISKDEDKKITVEGYLKGEYKTEREYHYPLTYRYRLVESIEADRIISVAITILLYTWPLILLLCQRQELFFKKKHSKKIYHTLGVLLPVISGTELYLHSSILADPEYGAWISLSVLTILFLAEIIQMIMEKKGFM